MCNTPVRVGPHSSVRWSDAGRGRLVDGERIGRIAARFTPGVGTPLNASLCDRCVEILLVQGAGVSIMSGRNSGPVCSSSVRVRQLEDLQFSLGEGPCHDAYTTGSMVTEPNLADGSNIRWPNYTPPALDLGVCAVFALPLRIRAGIVGVLTLYQDSVGMLTDDQTADGRVLALMLPTIMSEIQARAPDPLPAGVLSDADAHRAEVHQASGMMAVQLGIDVDDALARIRAHAYATNETVARVAGEILASGQSVIDTDLREAIERWPRFTPYAVGAGYESVYAIPLRLRGDIIGVLNLFRADPGPLDDDDVALAQALADLASIAILQAAAATESRQREEQLQHALDSRTVIEQAKGMLAEHANIDVASAFDHIRARARNTNTKLTVVAARVVDGQLDLDAFVAKPSSTP